MNSTEDRLWTNLTIPSAIFLKVLTVVTAAWEFTISEKSEIRSSFLRAIRYGVGSNIFNNCDLLPRYICCLFEKDSGRPAISVLSTSAQSERWNYAASLNLLKLNSLSMSVLFGFPFAVYVAESTKLFLVSVSETFFRTWKAIYQQIICIFVEVLPVLNQQKHAASHYMRCLIRSW